MARARPNNGRVAELGRPWSDEDSFPKKTEALTRKRHALAFLAREELPRVLHLQVLGIYKWQGLHAIDGVTSRSLRSLRGARSAAPPPSECDRFGGLAQYWTGCRERRSLVPLGERPECALHTDLPIETAADLLRWPPSATLSYRSLLSRRHVTAAVDLPSSVSGRLQPEPTIVCVQRPNYFGASPVSDGRRPMRASALDRLTRELVALLSIHVRVCTRVSMGALEDSDELLRRRVLNSNPLSSLCVLIVFRVPPPPPHTILAFGATLLIWNLAYSTATTHFVNGGETRSSVMADEGMSSPEGVADCPTGSMLLPLITSVASLIGCFYVVGTYWRVSALRQHPAGIMFGMSLYGAIYQFLYLLDQASSSVQCRDMGIIVDFFLTGQETYMLIFAIDLLLALKNPFSASKGQMTKYHIFGGLWSLICAVISHFDTQYALFGFCWLSSSGDILNRPHNPANGGEASNGTPTAGIFFALYIVVVYCTSLIAIVRTWNTFVRGLPDTFRTRKRIQRHLKYYVGCYFGYWTLVLACYAVFSLLPHSSTDGKGGIRCRVWHLLSCLLLAKGMVHALIWTRTSNILRIIEQLRRDGTANLPSEDGNWDDNINWALRLEILTNTTKGICQSVDRAERQARASAESSIRSVSAVSGSSLEEGINGSSAGQDDYCDRKESYTQIEELILEKRNDQRAHGPRTEGVVFKDFAPHVFRRLREEAKVSSASYRNSLQQTTKERVSEGKSGAFFYFTEDRKYVVKTLTNEELKSLLGILPKYYTFMKRNPDTFMTRFFGCHGLTMYGKTVFFVVMQSVFATSLQIHERFDLKGSWVGRLEGRKPTGTIATCKFCNAEYTIGGSHDQRCNVRREGNMNHQYDQVGKDLNWNRHMALPYSTARAVAVQLTADSDFLCSINCIDYSLLVGIHHRSFNVSHYSSADSFDSPALVHHDSCCSMSSAGGQFRVSNRSGRSYSSDSYNFSINSSFVRNRSSSGGNRISRGCSCSSGSNGVKKSLHQVAHGGGMSVDEVHGPGLYYLGLIDMLQQWNFRKRVEHFIRVYLLLQDRHGISVVNPRQYADRFQQRVIKELIYDAAALPMRDHQDSVSFTQLQIQDQRNAQLVESNRTLSTMLASLDGSAATFASRPSTRMEPFTNVTMSPNVGVNSTTNSPCTPPIASAMPTKAGAAIRAVSVRHRSSCSWDSGSCCSSSGVGRLSGGLVMEIPPTLPVVYPTTLDTLPPHLRRSLAPLTPSPRTSSVFRRDSEYSKSSNQHSGSSVYARSSEASSSNGSRQCSTGDKNSHSSTGSANVVHLEEGALRGPSSPHDYRIVSTPTFPDKGGVNAATLSA
ncbi:phosphatidylinositol-4-phosphate 5-kinase-like protein 1 [Phytophthora pseudosyringae]|uniref:Phosphatidylinositol-4-phosphate 5-kinase-like protein 1 n=1 Tax=Phytophthora pseudosyringae TaxID=221518 RepID=A0A8T1W876_9STRA|nr:phosphatidylinositol-4-phosphate 5-kinase-like protein 1 [Phytophthora pseudosyringae]